MPTLLPIAPTLPPLPGGKNRGLSQFDCREGGESNFLASILAMTSCVQWQVEQMVCHWPGTDCLFRDSISGQSTRLCANVGGHRNLPDRGHHVATTVMTEG
jgi:hypothetical protein